MASDVASVDCSDQLDCNFDADIIVPFDSRQQFRRVVIYEDVDRFEETVGEAAVPIADEEVLDEAPWMLVWHFEPAGEVRLRFSKPLLRNHLPAAAPDAGSAADFAAQGFIPPPPSVPVTSLLLSSPFCTVCEEPLGSERVALPAPPPPRLPLPVAVDDPTSTLVVETTANGVGEGPAFDCRPWLSWFTGGFTQDCGRERPHAPEELRRLLHSESPQAPGVGSSSPVTPPMGTPSLWPSCKPSAQGWVGKVAKDACVQLMETATCSKTPDAGEMNAN